MYLVKKGIPNLLLTSSSSLKRCRRLTSWTELLKHFHFPNWTDSCNVTHFLWKCPALYKSWTYQWAGLALSFLSASRFYHSPSLAVSLSLPLPLSLPSTSIPEHLESMTFTIYPPVFSALQFFAFELACRVWGQLCPPQTISWRAYHADRP